MSSEKTYKNKQLKKIIKLQYFQKSLKINMLWRTT
jgi:hypothetical protein